MTPPPGETSIMDPARTEGLILLDGFEHYLVPRIDRMDPFLVAVVSPGDHWMYASSAGGLAAGRVDAEGSLFPYRTDDLLHRVHGFSGGFTAVRTDAEVWEPFTGRATADIERHLARAVAGDRLVIEEIHRRLGLRATVRWTFSEPSGIVRRTSIERLDGGDGTRRLQVLDGLRELIAGEASVGVMQSMSCLVHAYTRAELVGDRGLAAIAMESALSDRAEPAESLRATVAWGTGLDDATIHLDAAAADAFLLERPVRSDRRITGRAAAYLREATIELAAGATASWSTVADVERSQREVVAIRERLATGGDLDAELEAEATASSEAMTRIAAETDALQCTGDPITDAHHRTNTLYNNMRGGIPFDRDRLPWGDWAAFCRSRNRPTGLRHADWLEARPADEIVTADTLLTEARERGDVDLERLALEYLPFWFGRRHGDPSRPWNRFSIRVRGEDGRRMLSYEGNWRDIFQNWEALALAHPVWLDRFIAKFVNATTPDGFNAYRLTRDGIDWEVPEPDNPWSNLGYWGDHQIVYLTRLLEASRTTAPERLAAWLDRPIFSFADVPYRLADHEALVADPRRSITFDHDAHAAAQARAETIGADGRLVHDDAGVIHATLSECLLVPVLAKLGSFVPDGGVWMNTQRPEWNDANNALAGYGLSMVTACQLRRHVSLLRELHASHRTSATTMHWSAASAAWLADTVAVLQQERPLLAAPTIDDDARRRVMDALGRAFETRRRADFGRPEIEMDAAAVVTLCELAIEWLDHAITANRRDDGLVHAYNLLQLAPGLAGVRHLPEMLEGQVAVLSAGVLAPEAAADLLDALFASPLHRPDLDTFLLQPAREIPAFVDKGVVPAGTVADTELLQRLVAANDRRLVEADPTGTVRFASGLRNGRDVTAILDTLATDAALAPLVADARRRILDTYETVFDHHAFTGRSGGMYGYEGIGCTYWHMVAKLLVAVGECVLDAERRSADPATLARLLDHYRRVRDGLGFRMDAVRFGALPIDAYSHSNGDGQARQPGMTGQVKEELLTRRMELGIRIESGELRFGSLLLEDRERLTTSKTWHLPGTEERRAISIDLPVGSLGFQLCGVPVVRHRGSGDLGTISIHRSNGTVQIVEGDRLDAATTTALLGRDGSIERIEVVAAS